MSKTGLASNVPGNAPGNLRSNPLLNTSLFTAESSDDERPTTSAKTNDRNLHRERAKTSLVSDEEEQHSFAKLAAENHEKKLPKVDRTGKNFRHILVEVSSDSESENSNDKDDAEVEEESDEESNDSEQAVAGIETYNGSDIQIIQDSDDDETAKKQKNTSIHQFLDHSKVVDLVSESISQMSVDEFEDEENDGRKAKQVNQSYHRDVDRSRSFIDGSPKREQATVAVLKPKVKSVIDKELFTDDAESKSEAEDQELPNIAPVLTSKSVEVKKQAENELQVPKVKSEPQPLPPIAKQSLLDKKPLPKVFVQAPSVIEDERELKKKSSELRMQLQSLHRVPMQYLPDGGEKLKLKMKSVESEMSRIDERLNQIRISKNQHPTATSNLAKPSQAQQSDEVILLDSSDEEDKKKVDTLPGPSSRLNDLTQISSGVSGAAPKPGRTILIPAQPQPLSDRLRQQNVENMFAAVPSHNRLFGGQMNDARWREARVMALEAIERLHQCLGSMPPESEETEDPKGLTITLKIHQRQALTWMLWRESQMPAGGCLCDEMGLGKTLTMLSLILLQKQRNRDEDDDNFFSKFTAKESLISSRATLIVCPTSLLGQWKGELKKHVKSGKLRLLEYYGSRREINAYKISNYDIVLTTYGTIQHEVGCASEFDEEEKTNENESPEIKIIHKRKNYNAGKSPLLSIAFARLVLDESHVIKNHKSITARAACRIRSGTRWAVTGTPIHNRLLEFYSLLRFLRVSPFDEHKVYQIWIEPAEKKNSPTADQRLKTLVKTLVLRRTKDQINPNTGKPIVSLPEKRQETYKISLSELERKVYDRLFEASRLKAAEFIQSQEQKDHELVAASRGQLDYDSLGYKNPFLKRSQQERRNGATDDKKPTGCEIFVALLRLRQATTHLALLKKAIDLEAFEDLNTQMEEMSLDDMKDVAKALEIEDLFEQQTKSTKLKAVLDLVKRIVRPEVREEGYKQQKCVIVSQWTSFLSIVELHLKRMDLEFTSITGEVPVDDRSNRVDNFNKSGGPLIMLISLQAGGVGLNLTGGSHLILCDLHWNPALELQAADRIHRIGQNFNVFIHKYVCENTIEERLLMIQNRKLELAKNVLSGTGLKNLNKLTLADLKMLFDLETMDKGASVSRRLKVV